MRAGKTNQLIKSAEMMGYLSLAALAGWTARDASVWNALLPYLAISMLVIGGTSSYRICKERQAERQVRDQATAQAAEAEARCQTALQHAEYVKTAFLKTMSHEFRTPLNAIMGFTELLTDDQAGPLNSLQRQYLEIVHGAGRELLHVLDLVLETAQLLSGRTQVSAALVDPLETIEQALRDVRSRAQDKRLQLVGPDGPLQAVCTDGRKMHHILSLLLDNAIKFTPRGCIEVRASKQADVLVIEVRDSGIGIPASELPHIFDLFRQGEPGLDRHHGGTGVGLFLARSLARLLGGELDATSNEGKGTKFVLQIPDLVPTEPYQQPGGGYDKPKAHGLPGATSHHDGQPKARGADGSLPQER